MDNYRLLGVPELWRYTKNGLQINLLHKGEYSQSSISPNFPGIPIIELVNRYAKESQKVGRSKAMKDFKAWITKNIS